MCRVCARQLTAVISLTKPKLKLPASWLRSLEISLSCRGKTKPFTLDRHTECGLCNSQEPATNLAASAPIHRSAPAAPSPIMAAPQFTAENSTSAEAPSENVSMLMNQLGSVQGMLSQLQNSSTEGSQLEGLLAQLESMPQPQARVSLLQACEACRLTRDAIAGNQCTNCNGSHACAHGETCLFVCTALSSACVDASAANGSKSVTIHGIPRNACH